MFNFKTLHNDESGQTALETAIILIAFVVVASVFAFTILSAGSSSTEKGEAAIYSGLENVQSSMAVKGAVIASGDTTTDKVTSVTFTMALASGGAPIDLGTESKVVISYRDANNTATIEHSTADPVVSGWGTKFLVNNGDEDAMLEDGELVEVTVFVPDTVTLKSNTEFTLEVKPPSGAVLNITRTTPAALDAVMELR